LAGKDKITLVAFPSKELLLLVIVIFLHERISRKPKKGVFY
jgi:hypothetical protein